jgi:hypothetical protein
MSTKDWRSSSGASTVAAMAWMSSRSSGTQPASRIPLGELDAGQPGGYFDGQVEAGAPALDEEGQGGGGLDHQGTGRIHAYSCTYYGCEATGRICPLDAKCAMSIYL